MPVDLNALFRTHGVAIEMNGDRGIGLPFSQGLLDTLDLEDLRAKSRQPIVAGDMLTAVLKRDEHGEFETDANGLPKRTGGYLKLVASNNLTILVSRQDEPGEFSRVNANNTRQAAAALIQMEHAARHEIAAIERNHTEALERYEAARLRGEDVPAPERATPKHIPSQFGAYQGFISAAQDAIRSELTNAFATAEERRSELYASMTIRNAQRNALTSEQVSLIAEAESLREQIARISPDHELAQRAIVAPYHGRDGEALKEGIGRVQEAGAGYFQKGVPRMGAAAALVDPLMATFSRMRAEDIMMSRLSPDQRRKFEQVMARHENTEIGNDVRPRIEAIMDNRMPGYQCAVRFYAHQGVDYLLIHDIGGVSVYAGDSAARTQDLDIERLNRVPTEADVPDADQIAALRTALSELTFDNGADVDFSFGDDEDQDPDADEIAFDV